MESAQAKIFCDESYRFLVKRMPSWISEERLGAYFVGDSKDYVSLNDVFERMIISAQNYQSMPNVIGYSGKNRTRIEPIIFGHDYKKILKHYDSGSLCETFRKELGIKRKDGKHNSWHKWSGSVVSSAEFVSRFSDANDFGKFVNSFGYNEMAITALPLLIAREVDGFGFALACDFLKELGFVQYCKPDVHMIDVFHGLGLCEKDSFSVFECLTKTARAAGITPYKLDKTIWLICTGKFYLDEGHGKPIGKKKQYIEHMKAFCR